MARHQCFEQRKRLELVAGGLSMDRIVTETWVTGRGTTREGSLTWGCNAQGERSNGWIGRSGVERLTGRFGWEGWREREEE